MNSQDYRNIVASNLDTIKVKMNNVLSGHNLQDIKPILARIDVSSTVPDWFIMLEKGKGVPTKDGKTIGSILEKLLVCVLEKHILTNAPFNLSVNPARGVDIPELELGVKSPSTNFCTSEPYFSAYERLLGNEYDAIILLTDFQNTKGKNNLELQIMDIKYLKGSEIADMKLCNYAKQIRDNTNLDSTSVKKLVRFFAYINQSDWEGKQILDIINEVIIKHHNINSILNQIKIKFNTTNRERIKEKKLQLNPDIINRLKKIKYFRPIEQGVICAADNWVIENQSDNGRFPNDNEWRRFQCSPLDGKITMSFALQWRYNFGSIFKITKEQHKTRLLDWNINDK